MRSLGRARAEKERLGPSCRCPFDAISVKDNVFGPCIGPEFWIQCGVYKGLLAMSKNHRRDKLQRAVLCLLAVLSLLILPGLAVGDSLTIDDWNLSTGISNSFTGETVFDFSATVQNPFIDSHNVVLGPSMASSDYDFSWSPLTGAGSFRIDTDQRAQGVPSSLLRTSSSGSIWFTTTEDLLLTVDMVVSYDLPADYMTASLEFLVAHVDPFATLLIVGDYASTWPGTPSSGTLVGSGQVLVPAGDAYLIRYFAELTTFGNTVGHFATGAGTIDFQFQPIPEPGTLSLLAVAALGCLKRRRPRCRQCERHDHHSRQRPLSATPPFSSSSVLSPA